MLISKQIELLLQYIFLQVPYSLMSGEHNF